MDYWIFKKLIEGLKYTKNDQQHYVFQRVFVYKLFSFHQGQTCVSHYIAHHHYK